MRVNSGVKVPEIPGQQNAGDKVQLLRCPFCRVEFKPGRSWQKFCRPQCRSSMKYRKRSGLSFSFDRIATRLVNEKDAPVGPPPYGVCANHGRAFVVSGELQCCGAKYAGN